MAATPKERFLTDEHGKRVAVVLDIAEYNRMIDELEELEDVRAFDAAKAPREKPIPLDQALAEVERKRARR